MNTLSNSERFLAAFASIESAMEKKIKADRYVSYSEMVRRCASTDNSYHKYQRYLEEFGDLRNAIVHERIDGEVVAEPHLKLAEEIEQIAKLLTQPEKVRDYFLRNVEFCYVDEMLESVLARLMKNRFSKMPVYDHSQKFIGLITTDAIAYYLAGNIVNIEKCMPNVTIETIMDLDDKYRSVGFVNVSTSLLNVVSEFENSLVQGKRLNAVIITQDGAMNQKPLGIVTMTDLPMIYERLNRNLL